ncbi:hypothetical protein PDIG_71660 [Penicillium digitatum PHI26]|uniref:Uncharacterized protein n=2 Tax=Penicillium digitatum TaxID=36651 RepID=K9G370_PEND2|nr:hypothetical protein PDIP_80960 [Penicillium digitatum Pd1]EKV06030.1 hypothetical protein PDIP_80960 [Penicillium digitatum Pd1]EKV07736.1 hypothetical protein PDIG_71660 [Penicillium digitatum PHI26]
MAVIPHALVPARTRLAGIVVTAPRVLLSSSISLYSSSTSSALKISTVELTARTISNQRRR